MSAFTKLVKKNEDVKIALVKIEEDLDKEMSNSEADTEVLVHAFARIQKDFAEHVVAGAASFMQKIDTEDPVTGEKRFGQAMRTKILGLEEEVETMKTRIGQIEATLQSKQTWLEEAMKKEELKRKEQDDERKRREEEIKLEQEGKLKEEREKCEQATREAQAAEKELQMKAQLVRDQKQKRLLDIHAKHNDEVDRLHKILSMLLSSSTELPSIEQNLHSSVNIIMGNPALGTEDKDITKQQLVNPTGAPRVALQTVVDILDRIIKRPDDFACRKLKATHPVLREKLTGQPGSIRLLFAVGFKWMLNVTDEHGKESIQRQAVTPSMPSTPGDVEPDLPAHSSAQDNIQEEIFSLLLPAGTGQQAKELFLEMVEPPLDLGNPNKIDGRDPWITWFDGLTASRDQIQGILDFK